jgi:hypothetical protein
MQFEDHSMYVALTLAYTPAAPAALTKPPEPAPITTKLYTLSPV